MLAERLKSERVRLQLTQPDIAEMCDVTVQTVLRWEKKNSPIPSDKLEILAKNGFDVCFVLIGTTPDRSDSKDSLNYEEERLVDCFRRSSTANRKTILDVAALIAVVKE